MRRRTVALVRTPEQLLGTALASGGISVGLRRLQTGFVRSYALSVLAGATLVVLALLAVNLT